MRLFQIDIDRLVSLLLPTFLRTRIDFVFVRAMFQPVSTVLDRFNINRSGNLYNLGHNGQICYLRALLNDAFDTDLRRISVDDIERYDWVYIYPESADRPVWLDTVVIASEDFTGDTATDFVVTVPADINQSVKPQMISLINYYKLAGKRYSIIFE
jgi:hypothetical protein